MGYMYNMKKFSLFMLELVTNKYKFNSLSYYRRKQFHSIWNSEKWFFKNHILVGWFLRFSIGPIKMCSRDLKGQSLQNQRLNIIFRVITGYVCPTTYVWPYQNVTIMVKMVEVFFNNYESGDFFFFLQQWN